MTISIETEIDRLRAGQERGMEATMRTFNILFPTVSLFALVACGANSSTDGSDRNTDPASESSSSTSPKLLADGGGAADAIAPPPKGDAGESDGGFFGGDAGPPPPVNDGGIMPPPVNDGGIIVRDGGGIEGDGGIIVRDGGVIEGDGGAPPVSCSAGFAGNANHACNSDLEDFDSVVASCGKETPYVTSFVPDEFCGAGSSSSFSFECCPTQPTGCNDGIMLGAKGYCTADTELFSSAEADCKLGHGHITGFTLIPCETSGPAGESQGAEYTCCGE